MPIKVAMNRLFIMLTLSLGCLADVHAAEYKASYCELYVDRLTPFAAQDGTQKIAVFVKVSLNLLDGPLSRVGFFAVDSAAKQLVEISGEQFYHDSYWKFVFPAHMRTIGDFFLETEKGTTLLISSWSRQELLSNATGRSGGDYFVVGKDLFLSLLEAIEGLPARLRGTTSNTEDGPNRGIIPLPSIEFLNPRNCR